MRVSQNCPDKIYCDHCALEIDQKVPWIFVIVNGDGLDFINSSHFAAWTASVPVNAGPPELIAAATAVTKNS